MLNFLNFDVTSGLATNLRRLLSSNCSITSVLVYSQTTPMPNFQHIKCRDCCQAYFNMPRCALHPDYHLLHNGLDSDNINFPRLRVRESTPVSRHSPPPSPPNYKSSRREHWPSSKQDTSANPSPQLSRPRRSREGLGMPRCALHPDCHLLHDGLDSDNIGFPRLRVRESVAETALIEDLAARARERMDGKGDNPMRILLVHQ